MYTSVTLPQRYVTDVTSMLKKDRVERRRMGCLAALLRIPWRARRPPGSVFGRWLDLAVRGGTRRTQGIKVPFNGRFKAGSATVRRPPVCARLRASRGTFTIFLTTGRPGRLAIFSGGSVRGEEEAIHPTEHHRFLARIANLPSNLCRQGGKGTCDPDSRQQPSARGPRIPGALERWSSRKQH